MIDITNEIAGIQAAVTGSQIRSAIINALSALNNALPSFYNGPYSIAPSTSGFSVPVSGFAMASDLFIEAFPEATLISATFSENGTYNASSFSADGFDEIIISVPSAVLISHAFSENGSYYASDYSADGFNMINIDVPTSEDPFAIKNYLEMDGSQWFDTGYIPIPTARFEMVATFNSIQTGSWATLFATRDIEGGGPTTHAVWAGVHAGYSDKLCFAWGTTTSLLNETMNCKDKKTVYRLSSEGFSILVDDLFIPRGLLHSPGTITSAYSVYLFTMNQGGSDYGSTTRLIGKLYRFRIYEVESMIHEFIPWLDSSNVACLKDTITNTIIYNQGTGSPVYGTDS